MGIIRSDMVIFIALLEENRIFETVKELAQVVFAK
jgi:hypothetical protein